MDIKSIVARLDEVRTEMASLHELDELTEEQEARFEALVEEADTLKSDYEQVEKRTKAQEAAREIVKNHADKLVDVAPAYVPERSDNAPYSMDRVRSVNNVTNLEARKTAMDAIQRDDSLSDVDKDHVRGLIDRDASGRFARHMVAAASDEYRTGWAKAITGNTEALTSEEREAITAVRAASLTDGEGGYAVPSPLDPTIISTKATDVSPLRQISRTATITNDVWRGITSAGVTATYAAEAAEAGDNAPTLVQPTVTPAKAHAFVPASIEVTQDWASIASDLAEMFAEAKADLEAVEFVTGSGSDAPTGIITALLAASTTTVVDAATASAFNLADVYNVYEQLPAKHRARASWGANITIINDLRQFGTTDQYHGFLSDLAAGDPPQLMGRPVYEFTGMDSTVTTDAEILVFGDFSKFLIVDRVGLTVEYIPHLFATGNNRPSGQRGWYAYWRSGSNTLDDNAFRVLQA